MKENGMLAIGEDGLHVGFESTTKTAVSNGNRWRPRKDFIVSIFSATPVKRRWCRKVAVDVEWGEKYGIFPLVDASDQKDSFITMLSELILFGYEELLWFSRGFNQNLHENARQFKMLSTKIFSADSNILTEWQCFWPSHVMSPETFNPVNMTCQFSCRIENVKCHKAKHLQENRIVLCVAALAQASHSLESFLSRARRLRGGLAKWLIWVTMPSSSSLL